MLSISQKESILRKAGIAIPPFPRRRLPYQPRFEHDRSRYPEAERAADEELQLAVVRWKVEIETLYDVHIRLRVEAAIQTVKASALGEQRRGP